MTNVGDVLTVVGAAGGLVLLLIMALVPLLLDLPPRAPRVHKVAEVPVRVPAQRGPSALPTWTGAARHAVRPVRMEGAGSH